MDYLFIMHIAFASIRQINVVMFQFKCIGSMNIYLMFIISFLLHGCPPTILKLAPNLLSQIKIDGKWEYKINQKIYLNFYIIK